MELKEFITETLTQIIDGVVDAQERVKGKGALIAPSYGCSKGDRTVKINGQVIEVYEVEMNVSLTVTELKGKKVGVGINKVVNADFGKNSEKENESMNSIRFKVPITFPVMPEFADEHKRVSRML